MHLPAVEASVLVVTRFDVPADEGESFLVAAQHALSALAAQSGFRSGSIGRAIDQPAVWTLVTRWDGVGAYRRALSSFDVRTAFVPLTAKAADEAGAYEVLAEEGAKIGRDMSAAVPSGQSGPRGPRLAR
jgi:heme oxygenase (mycobilin-producing)